MMQYLKSNRKNFVGMISIVLFYLIFSYSMLNASQSNRFFSQTEDDEDLFIYLPVSFLDGVKANPPEAKIRQNGDIQINGDLQENGRVDVVIPVKNFGSAPDEFHVFVEGETSVNETWQTNHENSTNLILNPGDSASITVSQTIMDGSFGIWDTSGGVFISNNEANTGYSILPSNGYDQNVSFYVESQISDAFFDNGAVVYSKECFGEDFTTSIPNLTSINIEEEIYQIQFSGIANNLIGADYLTYYQIDETTYDIFKTEGLISSVSESVESVPLFFGGGGGCMNPIPSGTYTVKFFANDRLLMKISVKID